MQQRVSRRMHSMRSSLCVIDGPVLPCSQFEAEVERLGIATCLPADPCVLASAFILCWEWSCLCSNVALGLMPWVHSLDHHPNTTPHANRAGWLSVPSNTASSAEPMHAAPKRLSQIEAQIDTCMSLGVQQQDRVSDTVGSGG